MDKQSKKLLYGDKYNNLINSSSEPLNPTNLRPALKHSERAVVRTNEDLASQGDS
jgi:hypothetical protein